MARSRVVAPCAAILALACAGPVATDESPAAPGGYVQLDEVARDAGWFLRVGGWCVPPSGETPVEVSLDEWVLIQRWTGEEHETELLHPTPGVLISLRGAELDAELIELGEPLVLDEPALEDDDSVGEPEP